MCKKWRRKERLRRLPTRSVPVTLQLQHALLPGPNASTTTKEKQQQLDKLEDLINSIDDFREYEVELHGHTDNIGSIEFNQYLSEMRCRAVFFELLRMEIPKEVITVHEYGELSPVFSNRSFQGKLHNRRVDVIIRKIMA